jgi:diadenosine tetraphosphate (Ap4A) HIT family hydrolase
MAAGDWRLDPRLLADTHAVAVLGLSELRLLDDARWPWLVLVPRVADARELIDLDATQSALLLDEVGRCSRALRALHAPHKLNVAALGNVVEQLHVHVIARRRDDPAWPRPVWGVGERLPYPGAARDRAIDALRQALA